MDLPGYVRAPAQCCEDPESAGSASRSQRKGRPGAVGLRAVALYTAVNIVVIWAYACVSATPQPDRVMQPICNSWVMTKCGEEWLQVFPMWGYRELASYPMWGYSLLLVLLRSVGAVVVVQSILGGLAAALLMVRVTCQERKVNVVVRVLFVTSLPWISYMSYAYQQPMSWALRLISLVVLERAYSKRSAGWAIGAGVLWGAAQNFRSELVLFPIVLLFALMLGAWLRWTEAGPLRPVLAFGLIALGLQVPWAVHCRVNAGRFSLSESNLGHVAVRGLAQLAENPWGLVDSDAYAADLVRSSGSACSSLSFEGGDFLLRKCVEYIRNDPFAYCKGILSRARVTLLTSFSVIEPRVSAGADKAAKETRARDLLKWREFCSKVARSAEGSSCVVLPQEVAVVHLCRVLASGLGLSISLLGIMGAMLAVKRGPFLLREPIVFFLGVLIMYTMALNVMLYASGAYMAGVYLAYLPFAANAAAMGFRGFAYIAAQIASRRMSEF